MMPTSCAGSTARSALDAAAGDRERRQHEIDRGQRLRGSPPCAATPRASRSNAKNVADANRAAFGADADLVLAQLRGSATARSWAPRASSSVFMKRSRAAPVQNALQLSIARRIASRDGPPSVGRALPLEIVVKSHTRHEVSAIMSHARAVVRVGERVCARLPVDRGIGRLRRVARDRPRRFFALARDQRCEQDQPPHQLHRLRGCTS